MSNEYDFPSSDRSNKLNENENNKLCEYLTQMALLVCFRLVYFIK